MVQGDKANQALWTGDNSAHQCINPEFAKGSMSTRSAIEAVASNLEDSMGVRVIESHPKLSPTAKAKDSGRRPLRGFGTVAVAEVVPDPTQPRKSFDEDSLYELATSIKSKGQLQPIRVRWSDELGKWTIVAGERRWRAADLAGLDSITCYFHEGQLSESEILEEQVIENIHRCSLQPIEEARAYSTLMQLNDWNGKQVADSLGIHPAKVSRALSLLKLPDDIQRKVEAGELAARTAYEISKAKDDGLRRQLANEASRGLTNEQAAKKVRQRKGSKKKRRRHRTVRLSFQASDGWQINVTRTKSGNYHEIEQALNEVLEEVKHRINNNVQLF